MRNSQNVETQGTHAIVQLTVRFLFCVCHRNLEIKIYKTTILPTVYMGMKYGLLL